MKPKRRWEGNIEKTGCDNVRMYCVLLFSERQYLLWPVTYKVCLKSNATGGIKFCINN
jgi:hypothetical protein